MKKELHIRISPQEASEEQYYKPIVARELNIAQDEITTIHIVKRSIDARKQLVKVQLYLDVYVSEEAPRVVLSRFDYKDVSNSPEVVVVGAGPGGLFAALRLIELGFKPVVIERGKPVNERKRDLALLNRNEELNTESNYAFGEGGAGAFSDGKLYTRSTKRGDFRKVVEVFHHHGAQDDILIDSHPHIGSDRLPGVIKNMRESIINAGGVVKFDTRVNNLIVEGDTIKGVVTTAGDRIEGRAVILATGHSARDVYRFLNAAEIHLEAKSWAMGVRVEHPQEMIDQTQYHSKDGRGEYLPAASYNLSTQVDGRGAFSFCMCPGGIIVPSMTDEQEVVVNGMSPSKRNSPFANSGIVVEIKPEDFVQYRDKGPLAGLEYQSELERLAHINSGSSYSAPAQRLADFVDGHLSFDLPECSYMPGVISSPLHFWLPDEIGLRLRKAFDVFDRKIRGFVTNEAMVVGVESRTSSPVRIPRDRETFQHVQIKGLFPCGEGAGYAGGIASSAIDGERCAEKVDSWLNPTSGQ